MMVSERKLEVQRQARAVLGDKCFFEGSFCHGRLETHRKDGKSHSGSYHYTVIRNPAPWVLLCFRHHRFAQSCLSAGVEWKVVVEHYRKLWRVYKIRVKVYEQFKRCNVLLSQIFDRIAPNRAENAGRRKRRGYVGDERQGYREPVCGGVSLDEEFKEALRMQEEA